MQKEKNAYKNDLPVSLMISGWFLKNWSRTQYILFQCDVQTIKRCLSFYNSNNNDALNLAGLIYSRKIAKALIKYIVQNNPGIFDKMIANPESVTDAETRTNIIAGHFSKNPQDAIKVIKKFKPSEVEAKIYKKAKSYASRFARYEQSMSR